MRDKHVEHVDSVPPCFLPTGFGHCNEIIGGTSIKQIMHNDAVRPRETGSRQTGSRRTGSRQGSDRQFRQTVRVQTDRLARKDPSRQERTGQGKTGQGGIKAMQSTGQNKSGQANPHQDRRGQDSAKADKKAARDQETDVQTDVLL